MKITYSIACLLFVLLSLHAKAGQKDTLAIKKDVVEALKSLKNVCYDYKMDILFPNGDNDHLTGSVYLDLDDKFYHNECNAYLLIYNTNWFYRADHRAKILQVVDVNKIYDKKLKKETERDIFQNGAINQFLDSTIMKKAVIKKYSSEDGILKITLGFPLKETAQSVSIEINQTTGMPVSYNMLVHHVWRKTKKGVQVILSTISTNNFRKPQDKSAYNINNYFTANNGKINVVKYKTYQLTTKM